MVQNYNWEKMYGGNYWKIPDRDYQLLMQGHRFFLALTELFKLGGTLSAGCDLSRSEIYIVFGIDEISMDLTTTLANFMSDPEQFLDTITSLISRLIAQHKANVFDKHPTFSMESLPSPFNPPGWIFGKAQDPNDKKKG